MTLFDRILLGIGSLFVGAAVIWGAAGATIADEPRPPRTESPPRDGQAEALDAATANLPPGVTIDQTTLRLVGLELEPFPGSEVVSWDALLAYEYQEGLAGMPEALLALEGKRVTMAGFLLTLYEFDDIKEFSLVASHWSCCFGVPPGLNGWIHVRLAEGQVGLPNTAEPIKVAGTFRLREDKEAGYVVSIFALDDAEARIIGW
ncbi:MAG: DUF3299 domain-containing protein [Planctomycetota bacterium]|jgi:hypothetical protein